MLLPVTAVKHSLEGRNIDGKLLYVLIWTLKKEATKPASLNFLQQQDQVRQVHRGLRQ